MRRATTLLTLGLVLTGLAVACSSASRSGFDTTSADAGNPGLGLGGDSGAQALLDVTLKGKVYAPNGSLPMGKTLIYVTLQKPAPFPEGPFCDECVTLPENTFGYSEPDGTFEIAAKLPKGKSFLVVQKGLFRRVREIELDEAGVVSIPKADTTLPSQSDPSEGDDVPKMLVVKDTAKYDKIELSLDKLGVDDITIANSHATLEDLAELMKYHVVFIPCDIKADSRAEDSQVQQNLQDYVKAGGRLYVTDWSYEFINRPFAGFVSFTGDTGTLGSATIGMWKAPATADDPDLAAWLDATGDSSFEVEGNYTAIASVQAQPGLNAKGETVDITPKVWVTADRNGTPTPTTVSFESQCGRALFSSYHTEANFGSSLHAQEKALLYVLLEVGVCIGNTGVK